MSAASNYFENLICNVFRGTNITAFTAYIALFDGSPGEAGTDATEITTDINSSGRIAVSFNAPSNGVMDTASAIDFGLSESAVTLGGFALFDAASAGNMIAYGSLTSTSVEIGDQVGFAAKAIVLTVR